MANFVIGDMWNVFDKANLFLITTNAVVKHDGRLVMGRGIALQARERIVDLDLMLGRAIRAHPEYPAYGLVVVEEWPQIKIGAFQVKYEYNRPAELSLIRMSCDKLDRWCQQFPDKQVHLNFPGIGNGRLSRKVVLPLVAALPDTVTVWEFDCSVSASHSCVHAKFDEYE